ncbi:MAG: YtcA family lipoprotein [Planctomycetota bacterium]
MSDRTSRAADRWLMASGTFAVFCCTGCNPNLDIDGALLPAWIIAGVIGLVFTVAARTILMRTGVDRHLVGRPAVYFALAITFTCVTWLTLFRF